MAASNYAGEQRKFGRALTKTNMVDSGNTDIWHHPMWDPDYMGDDGNWSSAASASVGLAFIVKYTAATGIAATTVVVAGLPWACQVIDWWVNLSEAGTTDEDLILWDGGSDGTGENVICSALQLDTGGTNDIFRAVELDTTHAVLAAGDYIVLESITTTVAHDGYIMLLRI